MAPLRLLLVHTHPLDYLGGAELGLKMLVERAPPQFRIDVIQPMQGVYLARYDAVILANLRPPGGVGEHGELEPALHWLDRLEHYRGFVLRNENDLHPCGLRDARCVACPGMKRITCGCSPRVPRAYEQLFNRCHVVQYLSPAHQQIVNAIINVRTEQVAIAPAMDLTPFQNRIPWRQRRKQALILGDEVRVAPSAEMRARDHGFEPVRVPYLSIPYAEMPALLNEYQAVVVDPVMFHAFGRVYVEARACGCQVLASERVGALSWRDPVLAVQQADRQFWGLVLRGIHGAPLRARGPGGSILRRSFSDSLAADES